MSHQIIVPRWFDRHLHIREGEMMAKVLPCTISQRATGALIMPNLAEPVSNTVRALSYLSSIQDLIPPGSDFKPKLALYLTDDISPSEVVSGFQTGLWAAVKLYLADKKGSGGTTNSSHGVRYLPGRYPVFAAMEKYKIPLLVHGELPESEVDEFDREIDFVYRELIPLLEAFPALPVVFEHVTDSRAAEIIAEHPANIRATVTAHHLMLSRNALFRSGLNPGHWCKPVLKREEHRLKIRKLVTSGHLRFGAGTDSAPHDLSKKTLCHGCAAGIFTAPIAVELYATVFEEDGALKNLGAFLSENFLSFYGMKASTEMMTLRKVLWRVPEKIGNIPVFRGGTELSWKLVA